MTATEQTVVAMANRQIIASPRVVNRVGENVDELS